MNLGDFALGATHDFQFGTAVGGVPTTLVGGTLAVYEGGVTTEITAGLTLTPDFDGKVGVHNVQIVMSAPNGFAVAKNYTIWLATGTVGGVTVAPTPLAIFSIANRAGHLDLPDAIEVGVTPRGAMRLGAAADAGLVAGAGSAQVQVSNAVAQDKTRITADVDASGNRAVVTTDLT